MSTSRKLLALLSLVLPTAVAAQPTLDGSSCLHPLDSADDGIGLVLAAADWDDDGRADLAVGAPYWDNGGLTNAGRIGTYAFEAAPEEWSPAGGISGGVDDRIGFALAAGDFDGDGVEEFAYSAPFDGGGWVKVRGSCGGTCGTQIGIALEQGTNDIRGDAEAGDAFGFALAAGDFDDDGYDDLAVGVMSETWTDGDIEDQGAVHVFYGTPSGLDGARDELVGQDAFTGQTREDGDWFGYALAAGDLDLDGYADLAIGVPFEDEGAITSSGVVHVVFGGPDGLDFTDPQNQTWSQSSPDVAGGPETGDHFGTAVAIGEFDGTLDPIFDGRDLAIGVPEEGDGATGQAGAIHVLYSDYEGPSGSGSTFLLRPGGSIASAGFGGRLLAADLDGDTIDDLLVSSYQPLYAPNGFEASGEVHVLFGRDEAPLVASGREPWRADAGSCHDEGVTGLEFGFALATGDFDEDGLVDLAIGIPGWSDSAIDIYKGAAQILFGSLFSDGFDIGDPSRWSEVEP